MFTGWVDLVRSILPSNRKQKEFVSVDARYENKKDLRTPRSYEMLSRDTSAGVTPLSPAQSPLSGRRSPDYFGRTARYHAPTTSFSSPRPPARGSWDPQQTYARPGVEKLNPLGMNKT